MLYEILCLSDTRITWQTFVVRDHSDGNGQVIEGSTLRRPTANVGMLLLSGWEPISSGYGETIFRRSWQGDDYLRGEFRVKLAPCGRCKKDTYFDRNGFCLSCGVQR
jgi:hypothetical protein